MDFTTFINAFNTTKTKAEFMETVQDLLGDHLVELDGRWEWGAVKMTDTEQMTVEEALYAAAEAAYDAFIQKLGFKPAPPPIY